MGTTDPEQRQRLEEIHREALRQSGGDVAAARRLVASRFGAARHPDDQALSDAIIDDLVFEDAIAALYTLRELDRPAAMRVAYDLVSDLHRRGYRRPDAPRSEPPAARWVKDEKKGE